jgi:hypothetical protein
MELINKENHSPYITVLASKNVTSTNVVRFLGGNCIMCISIHLAFILLFFLLKEKLLRFRWHTVT